MQEKGRNPLGNIIKQRRLLSDLTIDALAKKAGLSPTLIGRVERGERSPSVRAFRKIAAVLDIVEAELLIHANYLSKPASRANNGQDTQVMKLDPKVLLELSKEKPATQRAVIAILKTLRSLAEDIASGKDTDK